MKRIDVCSPTIGSSQRDLAEHVAHDEQGDEEREGEEDVGDAHQHVVEEPAADAGDGADGGADDDADDRRGEPDGRATPGCRRSAGCRGRGRSRRCRTRPSDCGER